MKKMLALLMALLCCVVMVACEKDEQPVDNSKDEVVEKDKDNKSDKEDKKEKEDTEKDDKEDEEDNEEKDEDDSVEDTKKKNKKTEKPKAETIKLIDGATGSVTENDEPDTFALALDTSGVIAINLKSSEIESLSMKIYNADGQDVWSEYAYWDSTSKQIAYKNEVELVSGNYSLIVSKNRGVGAFTVSVDFTSAGESFAESLSSNNNIFADSCAIETDMNYFGQIAINDEIDNYMFEIKDAGKLNITFKAQDIESSYLKIYDEDGQEIWSEYMYYNSTSKQISYKNTIHLTRGVYYCSVSKNKGYGNYEFSFDYTSAKETFSENQNGSDNEFSDANSIKLDKEYTGQLAENDSIDIYTFETDNSKGVVLDVEATDISSAKATVYDEDGQEIWSEYMYSNSTSKKIAFTSDVVLEEGIYYLTMSKEKGLGSYDFEVKEK